eukprot:2837309-Amphidinium_carterae.1
MYDADGTYGQLKLVKKNGPESFPQWYDCFQVWRSCSIVLDAADAATIDAYGENGNALSDYKSLPKHREAVWLELLRKPPPPAH